MLETFYHLLYKIKQYNIDLLALMFGFLTPIYILLFICGFVILVDLFLGVKKSLKQNKKITSKGLYSTVQKMFVYQGVIIGTYFLDSKLLGEFVALVTDIPFVLTKVLTIGLVYVELRSINENMEILWNINVFERVVIVVKRAFTFKKEFDKYE